ncbi:hypothetical protein BDQ12DRAFT_222185 [Crucibulum laeve]|uniref:Uncharacterized protein n=1 Tax=Crucibulum laeve TaxID=68775 RepID=A0A5C3LWK6_9AGAR|nr:hypothetical protein BDQ12DRAFT_222185 [Crucibulum laeve]
MYCEGPAGGIDNQVRGVMVHGVSFGVYNSQLVRRCTVPCFIVNSVLFRHEGVRGLWGISSTARVCGGGRGYALGKVTVMVRLGGVPWVPSPSGLYVIGDKGRERVAHSALSSLLYPVPFDRVSCPSHCVDLSIAFLCSGACRFLPLWYSSGSLGLAPSFVGSGPWDENQGESARPEGCVRKVERRR